MMKSRQYVGVAVLFVALAIIVAGCGEAGIDDVTASGVTAAQTGAATQQEAPTSTPVTLLPDAGTGEEGSPDEVAVADVIQVDAGETFTKVWRLRNTGTREWSDAAGQYKWLFVGGDQMNGPSQVPILEAVPQGGDYSVEVTLTAPAAPGLYEGNWQLHDAAGQPVGPAFGLRVEVLSAQAGTEAGVAEAGSETAATEVDRSAFVTASTAPQAGTEASGAEAVAVEEGCLDSAWVADVTIPDGTAMDPGETFTKIWRLRNAGTCAWSEALGAFQWAFVSGDQMGGPDQVPIPEAVPSGGEYDVELELTAPAEPGEHEGRWQVQGPNGDPLGVIFWVLIDVLDKSSAVVTDGTGATDDSAGGAATAGGGDLAQEVWQHINGERDRQKLYQLAYNETLALAAQRHADDCSQRGSCSHAGSDGSDEAERVRRVGYQGSVDESWAWMASPLAAVNWWLDEVPPNDWHRRMLLTEYFTQVGVGVAPAETGYYFIAVFGITGH
jgi:uncharacterized protein YkwD